MTKYRIVNKNEKGCILNILPQGLTEITWEEFNRKYLIKEKVYAILNPTWQERQDKIDALLKEAVAIYSRNEKVDEPNPDDSKRLNEVTAELMKITHLKVDDALTMIQEKIQQNRQRKAARKAKKVKQQKKEYVKKEKVDKNAPREYGNRNLKKTTIGDAIPGLKELLEKK